MIPQPRPPPTVRRESVEKRAKVRKRRLELFYAPVTARGDTDYGESSSNNNNDEDKELHQLSSCEQPADEYHQVVVDCDGAIGSDGLNNAKMMLRQEHQQTWDGLVDVLWKHFLFSGTRREHLERVATCMEPFCPEKGQVIIKEGDVGDVMYVVERGELHVTCGNTDQDVDIIGPNRVFGELAVLFDSPRAATVTARSADTRLWCLSRSTLRLLENNFMSENLENRACQLRRIPEFEKMDDAKLRRLAAVMLEEKFPEGSIICKEGDVLVPNVNDKFYTIATGCVQVSVSLKRAGSDDSDETQLVDELDDLHLAVGGASAAAAAANDDKENAYCGLASNNNNNNNKNMDEWKEEASEGDCKIIAKLREGQWFGEMALLNDDPRSATVIAIEPTYCYTLTKSAFQQVVKNDSTFKRIASTSELRKEDNHETFFRHERLDCAKQIQSLSDLEIRHVIGEGAFSVVRLVTANRNTAFALKTMNKQDLTDRNQVTHVNNERSILAQSSHPFILSLIKTFQTRDHIYMLFELVQGGELFSLVIDSNGGLDPRQAQFYAACITEGLSYLHRKRIAYRDLKLENLVIARDGYLKIIDFGFAKKLSHEGDTTRTLCGTPDYLAPEAVTRHGHSYMVDCWSLGVVLFEMLTQYSPFADTTGSGNQMLVFRKIIQGADGVDWTQLQRVFEEEEDERQSTTKGTTFEIVKDLLHRLWDPNPHTRLTCAQLKQPHPYFKNISFIKLREKQIRNVPWVPQISDYKDTSHFDVQSFLHVQESVAPYQNIKDVHAFENF